MPEESHSAPHQGPMGEESPRLSSPLSTGDHVQGNVDLAPVCYGQVCVEPLDGEGERPVSLVSTLSSGSSRDSRSLFGSTAALPSSTTPPIPSEEDINLELSPAESTREQARNQSPTMTGSRERWRDQLEPRAISNQWNNNNATASRTASSGIHYIPTSPVVTDTMASNPKLTYVDRVVMEIIETERMYVKDLRSIVEDYLAHIIDTGNLPIRPEQVSALFGNIEDIYEFNSELLQSLDMCENDPVAIAQCFVNKSEYFEIYTQYCNNYPNSVATLTNCMRSKTLAKFFRDRQAVLKRSLPLGSYLLKPVQRILKYHLLLQEIAKHFHSDEEGYEVVQEAIDTMTGVAWYINDMKRKHEHAVRVQEIQSLLINWKGPDLTTYGELVLEGTFHVLRAKNTRTLFLFEKMLLITKKRGEHYVYKIHISCSTLMLLDSAKDPLLFSVIHFKRPKQPHTVQAKSVEEKRLWAHHIKRLILENHNTILPQRAIDTTVDNANYPGKYQYSPERMMKAECCQADDFHHGGRNGRRRSEPAKQIIRSTKAVLKDDQNIDAAELRSAPIDEEEAYTQEGSNGNVAEDETLSTQVSVQEAGLLDCVPQVHPQSNQLEVESPQSAESPVTPSEQEANTSETLDTSRETGEEEEGGSDSSGLQVKDTSVLTNGELSEEEEEVLSDHKSILPSSVLDQASAIAEHFISSLSRRSSLFSEDLGSVACPSPPVDNDAFQSPSACMDLEKQTQKMATTSSEPPENSEASQSVVVPDLSEGEQRSTLSKQDRLLIHKIRQYYDHAEDQDANFSIKRRESLSYIPAGLVRHLSRQLNSIPQEKVSPVCRKGLSRNRPTSWSVFDLPGLEKSQNTGNYKKTEPHRLFEAKARSQSVTEAAADEEFRPSYDMLKVWQVMEAEEESREVQDTAEEKVNGSRLEVLQDISSDTSDVKTRKQPPQILEESEMSTASDISSMSSPTSSSPTEEEKSGLDSKPRRNSEFQENDHFNPSHPSKVINFRTSMEEDQILHDMGKMKNKVFQLARQYSQRIKNNRPMVWQRNRQTANQEGPKNMPAVHEEKMRKRGKPNLRLPLHVSDEAVIHEVQSPSPVQTPSSEASSQSTITCPQSPQPEPFYWPDVQELRSKYTETSNSPRTACVCTEPNGMAECCMNGCNGCSHRYDSSTDLHNGPTDSCGKQSETVQKEKCPVVEDRPQHQTHSLLCRWSSLDNMLGSQPLHEVQNLPEPVRGVSPAGRLQDEDSLLMEDLNNAKSAFHSSGKASESNLVKSLREKFQSLSTS